MKGFCVVLALLMVCGGLVFPCSCEEKCDICSDLEKRGFPDSWQEPLCALLLRYPLWEFQPLPVTALSREQGKGYDFSYVVEQECQVTERNLVYAHGDYAPYRKAGEAAFDSDYYPASAEAVAYFLDSRNFLSEEDIFQFLLLSETVFAEESVIERVFRQTVWEGWRSADGRSLSALLTQWGKAYGVNPLFAAVRLRQEQGAEGSVLFWGKAGSLLLSQGDKRGVGLDGIYNPFHVGASGKGEAAVALSGALHGEKMGWHTMEAGLEGGIAKLCQDYIKSYQNTLYLQKWNVDIRSVTPQGGSRNFWGQYMQNIGGAKLEGRLLYQALAEAGLLEERLCFLIPVYEGMPLFCPDPAMGACPAFAAAPVEESQHFAASEVPAQNTVTKKTEKKKTAEREKESRKPFFWLGVPPILCGVFSVIWQKTKKNGEFRKKHKKMAKNSKKILFVFQFLCYNIGIKRG